MIQISKWSTNCKFNKDEKPTILLSIIPSKVHSVSPVCHSHLKDLVYHAHTT